MIMFNILQHGLLITCWMPYTCVMHLEIEPVDGTEVFYQYRVVVGEGDLHWGENNTKPQLCISFFVFQSHNTHLGWILVNYALLTGWCKFCGCLIQVSMLVVLDYFTNTMKKLRLSTELSKAFPCCFCSFMIHLNHMFSTRSTQCTMT